jgi:hypothetical protein
MRTKKEIQQALADITKLYDEGVLPVDSQRDLACMGGMLDWVLGGEDWGILDSIRQHFVRKEMGDDV